jgi:gliding motility-associated-like protein
MNRYNFLVRIGIVVFSLLVSLGVLADVTHWVGFGYNSSVQELATPVANFTFAPNSVCADQTITFTNTSSGYDLTYLWKFGDGQTSTAKHPTHTYLTAIGGGIQTFDVILEVKEKDIPSTKKSPVTVKEIPSLAIDSEQNTNDFEGLKYYIVCENTPSEFTFYNKVAETESNLKYQIDWGDGTQAFEGITWADLKHTYAVGIYNITYTVTPINGCKVSRKFGVFVGSNPAVGLGNPGNTNVCVSEQLTFPITGTTNNPTGTIYTVTFSDGSTPQTFTHPPPASVTHIFTKGSCGETADNFTNSFSVKILAQNPCAVSQASVVPIYVSEPPIPKIKISSDVLCLDKSIRIENTTDSESEVSANGKCNVNKKFVWKISPSTGWTLPSGSSLGSQTYPTSPNSWSSGSDILNPTFTKSGKYTIKLIVGNRCGVREEIKTITVIPTPEPSFTFGDSEVCGPATVTVTNTSNILTIPEANTPTTYNWSVNYTTGNCGTSRGDSFAPGSDKNSVSPTFNFTKPGIYTLTLTIKESCGTYIEKQTITVTAPPTIRIAPIPDSCEPVKITPTADVSVCEAGTPAYKWTFQGGTPATSTSLIPGEIEFSAVGDHKITLEVTSSCGTTINETTFKISRPPTISAGLDDKICNGEEIELKGSALGGSENFEYRWKSIPSISIANANTLNPKVKPSQTTQFTLTVRDKDTGCESVDVVEIIVIPAPTIEFDQPDQNSCSGETTNPVNVISNPSGEAITWTSVASGVIGVEISGTDKIPAQTLVNKTANPITVTYTALISASSLGNCAVTSVKYTITVNPEPDYKDDKLSVCSDQNFNYTPINIISGSKFTWTVTTPAGISGASNSTQPAGTISQQLTNTTNAPIKVIYTVNPILNNCKGKLFTIEVLVQPAPSTTFSESEQNLCTGSDSKQVQLSSDVSGATFSWNVDPKGVSGVITSGTDVIPVQSLTNTTNQPITLEYKVSVKTSAGGACAGVPKTYRITVNPSVKLSPAISDFNGFEISCTGENNGQISLNPSGGNGVFTYEWKGPSGFVSTQKDLINLVPGVYEVRVYDEFGCSTNDNFELKEPQKLEAKVREITKVLCAGDESGAIDLDVFGGVKAYSFAWKRDGISITENTQNLSSVAAGDYEVEVKDANGCVYPISGIVITEPAAAIVINYTKVDISCYGANNGSLDLNVSGGIPPYAIKWTFGSDQSGFTNLRPGDYTLTVSDQSGCIRSQTITIEDAPLFKIEPVVKNISCFGEKDGSIELNLLGGVGESTIRWDHGEQLENLYNLTAGAYGVTIKEATSCEIRREFNIVEPAILAIEPKVSDALDCDNPQSGGIKLGLSGGTPPYSILWSNGSTSEFLDNIPAGQYLVEIVDASGCTISKVFEVKRPPQMSIVAFQNTTVQCEPRVIEDKVSITISAGIAPYSISWSAGDISADQKTMTTTTPGLYVVTVTDGKNCTETHSFQIDNSETIARSEIESTAFDQYNSYLVNFEIQFWNRSFGQILTYHWDFGDGQESFEENPKHTYAIEDNYEIVLTVTDIFGCQLRVKKEIEVLDYYLVMPNAFTPNGDGINDYIFPRFVGIEEIEFWVLNKWGETIFHTNEPSSQGWNGKVYNEAATPGNYVYRLKYKTLDGRIQTEIDQFILLK